MKNTCGKIKLPLTGVYVFKNDMDFFDFMFDLKNNDVIQAVERVARQDHPALYFLKLTASMIEDGQPKSQVLYAVCLYRSFKLVSKNQSWYVIVSPDVKEIFKHLDYLRLSTRDPHTVNMLIGVEEYLMNVLRGKD